MHAYDEMTEPELREHLQGLAKAIESHLPANTGFLLLAAPIGGPGVAQYLSNVERQCSAAWMAETLRRWLDGDLVPRVGG